MKKMPIENCLECRHFIDPEDIRDPDMCSVANRIIYADEDWINDTHLPQWCPKPKTVKPIDKCGDCNRKCGFQGYCWELKRIVDMELIDPDCPLEDCPFPDAEEAD